MRMKRTDGCTRMMMNAEAILVDGGISKIVLGVLHGNLQNNLRIKKK